MASELAAEAVAESAMVESDSKDCFFFEIGMKDMRCESIFG